MLYKVVGRHKLLIAYLSKIGAHAYYLNNKLKRSNKIES
jgi:hypothetical protein